MTLSVSRDSGNFEWAGRNLFSFFCQPSNILNSKMWRLLYDILRFNARARLLLVRSAHEPQVAEMSIGSYLQTEGYSETFIQNYLMVRMSLSSLVYPANRDPAHDGLHLEYASWHLLLRFPCASTSKVPPTSCQDLPHLSQVKFMNNHHLLQLLGKPSWLTIPGGRQDLGSLMGARRC